MSRHAETPSYGPLRDVLIREAESQMRVLWRQRRLTRAERDKARVALDAAKATTYAYQFRSQDLLLADLHLISLAYELKSAIRYRQIAEGRG